MTSYPVPLTYNKAIQLSLALDGQTYQASIGWSVFGQRSYFTLSDQYGNRLLTLPLIGSVQAASNSYTVADPQNLQTPAKSVTFGAVNPVNIVAGYFKRSAVVYYPKDQLLVVTP